MVSDGVIQASKISISNRFCIILEYLVFQ